MRFSFDSQDSYLRYLLSDGVGVCQSLHISRDGPSLTFAHFSTMLKHSPDMHRIASCLTPLTDPDTIEERLKTIFIVVLYLLKHKDSFRRWDIVEGNFERFRNIILSDEFLTVCSNREILMRVQCLKCPVNPLYQKYCLKINKKAIMQVYAEFDKVSSVKIKGREREVEHDATCVEECFTAIVNHIKLFSECVLRVCHAYDMCFVRKKAFTGCFAFAPNEMNRLLEHHERGNLLKFTLYCEINKPCASHDTEEECFYGSDEISPTRKRCTPPDRNSPPTKSMRVDEQEKCLSAVKQKSKELMMQLDSTLSREESALKKLSTNKVHRKSTWWEKFMLDLFFTQKTIHASNTLLSDNFDWELSHEDYIDVSKHLLEEHIPEYYRISVHAFPPWYMCIIKNIEAYSQSSTKKPFRGDSIDVLRKMCEWDDITAVFSLFHRIERDDLGSNPHIKSEISKLFNAKYKLECPSTLAPQTKAIMKILSQYSVLCHPPINTGPLWPPSNGR